MEYGIGESPEHVNQFTCSADVNKGNVPDEFSEEKTFTKYLMKRPDSAGGLSFDYENERNKEAQF